MRGRTEEQCGTEKRMEMSEQKGRLGQVRQGRQREEEKDNGELEQGVRDEEWRVKERSRLPYPKAVLI